MVPCLRQNPHNLSFARRHDQRNNDVLCVLLVVCVCDCVCVCVKEYASRARVCVCVCVEGGVKDKMCCGLLFCFVLFLFFVVVLVSHSCVVYKTYHMFHCAFFSSPSKI